MQAALEFDIPLDFMHHHKLYSHNFTREHFPYLSNYNNKTKQNKTGYPPWST